MITEPKIINRAEQPYVAIRSQVTMQEFGAGIIPQSFNEVAAWLQKQGKAPAGAPLIRYLVINMPGKLDVEIGWPVASALTGDGRVTAGILPAGRYASLVHTGPYPELVEATAALLKWAEEKGIHWDVQESANGDKFGSRFESYLTDSTQEPDPAKWETEIAIRIAHDQAS